MIKIKSAYLLLLLFLLSFNGNTQENYPEKLDIKLETAGIFTDGDYAPFWFTNNNYGIASEKANKEYLRVGGIYQRELFTQGLNASFGVDVLAAHNLQSDFYFHQIYGDFTYKILGLSIGMKERRSPFKNNLLSSGGMTLSGNARPIPQVEAGFNDFVEIPYTNGWAHLYGGLSYGKFLDDDVKKKYAGNGNYATDILYHRKYIFLKFEKQHPLSFTIGLEMDSQWGGHFYQKGEFVSASPAKIPDFFKIFVPMSGGDSSTGTDQMNILGNVYGSWHFILNYKKQDYSIKAYYENFYEDHSGLIFKNIPDGIYGIEFNFNKKQLISSVLFEYIHTKDQSGPFLWDTDENIPIQVSGGDDYYNHVEYVSLTNYGMVIGNPLLTSPIYNNGQTLMVKNNRISAFHGGISGFLNNEFSYRMLLTYSRSWGTPFLPSKTIRNQFSSLAEVSYSSPKLEGWSFSGGVAYDNSSLMVGKNLGCQLKISKTLHVK